MTWWGDHSTLIGFAEVLLSAGEFLGPAIVIRFFEKPWKWDDAYVKWVEHGSPTEDNAPSFDRFVEALS